MRIEHLSELYTQYLQFNDMLKRECSLLEEFNLHTDKTKGVMMFLVHKREDQTIAITNIVVNADGTTTLPAFMKKTYTAPSAYRSTDGGKTYVKVPDTVKPDYEEKWKIPDADLNFPGERLPPHRISPIILTQDIPDPDLVNRVMPTLIVGDDIVGVAPMKAPNESIFALRAKYKSNNE